MKFFLTGCSLLLLSITFSAQEVLESLQFNHQLINTHSKQKSGSSLDQSFIYLFDTVSLPFIDDFSTNKFFAFDADSSDSNVLDSIWYRLQDLGGNPTAVSTTFMEDTTYIIQYDSVTINGVDTMIVTNTPLPSLSIEVFDLNNYPVLSTIVEVWPSYTIYDTLFISGDLSDTIVNTNADLIQDSLQIYFVISTAADYASLWQDRFVYKNDNFPLDPPSIGVATFDGLDENGYPYDWSSASAQGVADYLTSKPIDLGSSQVGDSIYLSFLYQAGGLGESPDSQDSLVLEFYDIDNAVWRTIWSSPGLSNTDWNYQHIKLEDGAYFKENFQFRFKNYGSLTGSLDHWHVDYVILDDFRSYTDTTMDDWAFQYPLRSMLKEYTSIPWMHYKKDVYTPILDSVKVETYNSYDGAKILQPCSMELFYDQNLVATVPYASLVTNVAALSNFQMGYDLPLSFYFDTLTSDTFAIFQAKFNIATNTTPERLNVNDTLYHYQRFENYYAYDDGSAEAAYGLVGSGAELAVQFSLAGNLEDTIKSILIHFSPSVNNASADPFFIQIWDDLGGEPGNLIYTTDDASLPITFVPEYNLGVNGFYEYYLPEPIAVSGTYYVGWKQTSANKLNIGFDKNINHQDKIFYDLGSGWANTGFEGSLMLRPVFVSDMDPIFATDESYDFFPELKVFPNPSSFQLTIDLMGGIGRYFIHDLNGRLIDANELYESTVIDVSYWSNGVYLLSVEYENGLISREKIVIKH